MDRRDFLKGAAALGAIAGVAGVDGCATIGLPSAAAPTVPSVDMDSYLAQLDGTMEGIQRGEFFGDLVTAGTPTGAMVDTGLFAQREQLTRKILRTLTLTGMFLDLNEEDRAHPGMQARLWSAVSEIDSTIDATSETLTGLGADDRRALREKLRREPSIIGRVSDALDAKAALVQAPAKRRRHLRSLMGQVAWRLREQDPSVLIDEFADTYERAKRHVERGAQQAPATAPITTDQQSPHWDGTNWVQPSSPVQPLPAAPAPVAAEQSLPVMQVAALPPPPPELQPPEPVGPHRGRGQSTVNAGLITLGLGVTVAGIGGLVIAAGSFVGLILITVGALGLLAGLITLIVGAAMNANDPQLR